MWPLVVASLLATTMILERAFFWIQFWFFQNPSLREKLLHTPPDPEDKFTFGDPLAQVLWEYHRNGFAKAKALGQRKIEISRRYLPTLRLIGNLSTSLGLLGTVVGVSMSFHSMSLTDSLGVARGLSTALYTTIVGLIIFLITSLFLHLFMTLSEGLKKNMENALLELHLSEEGNNTSPSARVVEKETKAEEEDAAENPSSLIAPVLGGFLVASLAGIFWGAAVMAWGHEMAYLSTVMGLVCGVGVILFSQRSKLLPLQMISMVASLMGIGLGKYLSFYHFYKVELARQLGPDMALQLSVFSQNLLGSFTSHFTLVFGVFDIFWIGLSLFLAWSIPKGFFLYQKILTYQD